MRYFKEIFFLLTLLICSCSSQLKNLDFIKEEIRTYYESGEFDREVSETVSDAIEEFETIRVDDYSAVVFDVDETALSNYEITRETDFGYVHKLWDGWIEEARAPAIPAVKNLYDYLIEKGIKVIFLTGRKENQYEPTIKNLHYAGYTLFDTLIVRTKDENNLNALEFKSKKREALTVHGYKIIGTVGDQWSDLGGSFHGVQVKIPNYLYYIE